jgi:hypothetical protein
MFDRNRLPRWMMAAPVAGLLFAPVSPALAEAIVESEPAAVSDCRKLGVVQGQSGFGKHRGRTAPRLSKTRAITWARELGATHVVWNNSRARGIYNWMSTGTAYDCN